MHSSVLTEHLLYPARVLLGFICPSVREWGWREIVFLPSFPVSQLALKNWKRNPSSYLVFISPSLILLHSDYWEMGCPDMMYLLSSWKQTVYRASFPLGLLWVCRAWPKNHLSALSSPHMFSIELSILALGKVTSDSPENTSSHFSTLVMFDIWAAFVIVCFYLPEIILLLASPRLFSWFLWVSLDVPTWFPLLTAPPLFYFGPWPPCFSLYVFSTKAPTVTWFQCQLYDNEFQTFVFYLLSSDFWNKYGYIQFHTFYFHTSTFRHFKLTVISLPWHLPPKIQKQKCRANRC